MTVFGTLDVVRSATVRIERAADRLHLGTGFFAAPGMVLTAAHVVGGFGADELAIVWRGQRRTPATKPHLLTDPVANGSYPWPDAAIIDVAFDDHPCVRLSTKWPEHQDRSVYVWTYAADYDPTTVSGTSVLLTYAGPVAPDPDADPPWELVRLDRGRVIGGMSGSPVLDTHELTVCAIVKSTEEDKPLPAAYATAIVDVLKHPDPAVTRLKAGQQQYLERVGLDATAEQKARWGELPERVAAMIAKQEVVKDLARELDRQGPETSLEQLSEEEASLHVARRLFDCDLKTVTLVFRTLIADGLLTRDHARLMFDYVACCARLPTESLLWWIPPDAAEQLFVEATADEPRIAHVPTDQPATVELLVRRASSRGRLTLHEGEVHPPLDTGPLAWLKPFVELIADAVPGAPENWWEDDEMRAELVEWVRADGILLRFPAHELGDAEITQLRDKLGAFPFVLAGRSIPPQLANSAHVVSIEPTVQPAHESSGVLYYSQIPRT